MNDPHVVYLRYAVDAADAELDFRADPLELETDDYTVRLAADEEGVPGIVARTSARLADADPSVTEEVPPDTEAVVVMKSHYPNVEAARAAVEPYLRGFVSRFCGVWLAGAWRVAALAGLPGHFPPVLAGWCRRGGGRVGPVLVASCVPACGSGGEEFALFGCALGVFVGLAPAPEEARIE